MKASFRTPDEDRHVDMLDLVLLGKSSALDLSRYAHLIFMAIFAVVAIVFTSGRKRFQNLTLERVKVKIEKSGGVIEGTKRCGLLIKSAVEHAYWHGAQITRIDVAYDDRQGSWFVAIKSDDIRCCVWCDRKNRSDAPSLDVDRVFVDHDIKFFG